jgi:hypothetical protein
MIQLGAQSSSAADPGSEMLIRVVNTWRILLSYGPRPHYPWAEGSSLYSQEVPQTFSGEPVFNSRVFWGARSYGD